MRDRRRQAREEVQRLGERLGSNRRFRIPYLRSLALLAEWQGHGAQAITHLRRSRRVSHGDRLTGRTVADPGEVGKGV